MDLYDEGFKLQDMIDSDMRSLRSELGDIFANELNCSPGSHLEMNSGLAMDTLDSLDSELSNDGGSGWMNSSQLFNLSADFDSIGGLLVNPQTALPVSMSDSLMLTSPITVPSEVTETSSISSSPDANESEHLPTSSSITVTLPIQMISTNALSEMADMKEYSHVSLTLDVPTPSPATHSVSASQVQQIISSQEADVNENSDSPKPKSKNKSSKSNQQISNENAYPKPAYSYSCLIAMALKNSKTGSLPVNEIYDFMTENFPYFKTAPNGWKNSVRHNLSLNKCFEKIEKPSGNSAQRKGYLWAMNPAKVEKMEEELQKWGSKDPAAIRKSMANPERLELIEKGELKNSDVEPEVESMNVTQIKAEVEEEEEEEDKRGRDEDNETETEIKIQITNVGSDLLNNDFPSLSDSVSIDPCLPELDIQKGIWENLCEDRLQFLNESPAMSPKNENMDDDSSLESTPSSQSSYVHTNFIYKCAQRASSSSSSNRLLSHSSLTAGTDQGTTCDA